MYAAGSGPKTPLRVIFHVHISQQNYTLVTAKEKKWNIWEFAVSVQNFSPDKTALSAFEMLKSNKSIPVSDGPSLAQANGTGWAAETSFEPEQWELLSS